MSKHFQDLILHDFIDSIFSAYMTKVTGVAMSLSVIFLFINIGHMIWTGALKDQNFFKHIEFARCLVIMATIPFITPLMKLCFAFAMTVARSVQMNDADKDQLVSYMEHKTDQFYKDYESKSDLEKMKNNNFNHDNVIDKNGNVVDSKTNQSDIQLNRTVSEADNIETQKSSWTDYFNWLGNPMEVLLWLLDFIVTTAFLLIRFFYCCFYIYYIKFLCVLGVFAFAFSILPWSREKVSEWFGALWNALFIFTTFNLLDGMMKLSMGMTEQMFAFSSNDKSTGEAFTFDSTIPRIVFLFTLIVLYLKVPYLTSLYAGSSSGNSVFKDGMTSLATFTQNALTGGGGGRQNDTDSKQIQEGMDAGRPNSNGSGSGGSDITVSKT